MTLISRDDIHLRGRASPAKGADDETEYMSENSKKDPDFERTLAELEKLVEQLEKGDMSLNESLAGFKRGIELSRQCQSALDQAQQTVEKLVDPEDEDSLTDLDADA